MMYFNTIDNSVGEDRHRVQMLAWCEKYRVNIFVTFLVS
jgi:hypothetical protein